MRRGEYAMVAQEKTTKRSFFCVVGSLVDANNEQCFDMVVVVVLCGGWCWWTITYIVHI